MGRYEEMFNRLEQNSKPEGAFVPFTVVGDPNPQESFRIIQALIDGGADALELGFPFSDPLADGPVIQAAMDRALQANVNPASCMQLIKRIRTSNSTVPIGLLVYANLVHAWGIPEFYLECAAVGVDSVLVADVPVSEAGEFCVAAKVAGVHPIMLCPPNIDPISIQAVAQKGGGYTYLLSRAGVTGTDVSAAMPVDALLEQLKSLDAAPPLLGFGISEPEHVADAIRSGARGVIVGSAIVKIIEREHADIERICAELSDYVKQMKAATVVS